ncbi:MAG: hypothetical protein KF687_16520 [Cyclobacteriaceae bacterium]|nr:hypothetical protein [Cyclobacteriaceae bacterium]
MIVVFFHLLILFTLAFLWFRYSAGDNRLVYWVALLVKLGAGILLGYVYSAHYSDSDTFSFFQDSVELASMAKADWWSYLNYLWFEKDQAFSGENRTLFFVKLVSLFTVFTQDSYWIVSLYFSFFSFVASWWLVSVISWYHPMLRSSAMLAFLFFPSCIFWSSGIIKESVAMAMLCILSGLFVTIWNESKLSAIQVVVIFVTTWVLWSLKYYYAAVFFPVALAALLTRWFVTQRMRASAISAYREFVLLVVLLMVFVFVVTFVHPNFYPQRIFEVVVENYDSFSEKSEPEKMVHFKNLKPAVGSLLRHAPWALLSGLFRPFVWEASNVFSFFVSLENLLLLTLTFFSVRQFRVSLNSPHRLLIFAALLYCAVLCIFLTLSAPNFGTYVRYRVGFLPFFVMLIMYKSIPEQWFNKLFRMN